MVAEDAQGVVVGRGLDENRIAGFSEQSGDGVEGAGAPGGDGEVIAAQA